MKVLGFARKRLAQILPPETKVRRLYDKAITASKSILHKDEIQKSLQEHLRQAEEQISYLGLENTAYHEIMHAIKKSGEGNTLEKNIIDVLGVFTRWAWQVIGKDNESEAAGWLLFGPDGRIGMPYRFLVYREGINLKTAPLSVLKRGGKDAGTIAFPENAAREDVKEPGRYLTLKEWDQLKIREDLVAVEDKDGQRKLYRRQLHKGKDAVKHLVDDLAGKFIGRLAGGILGEIGEKNAYVELEETNFSETEVEPGEIIPLVAEGTRIKLVAADSNKPNLREKKMNKGVRVEAFCQKRGLKVGVVDQDVARAIGNVRTSALKPICLMIKDSNRFGLRPQNEFLLQIVGVKSYFIISIFDFNEQGEAVCLGALEVTNPEIIPENLTAGAEERLEHQFQTGQAFAKLVSAGIMIKLLQEEIKEVSRRNMGESIWRLVVERNFQALQGREIEDASIMFADISGFTALCNKLKDRPHAVTSMLTVLFRELDQIIVDHEGMVDKHIGDCIMGNFGVPFRQKGDVEQAVSSAIAIQMKLQQINNYPQSQEFYKRYGLNRLGMTIGIFTGAVIAGNVGHSKTEYTVVSDSVNQAARLQHAAARGQILIGERTYDLLSPGYRQQLVGQFNDYCLSLSSKWIAEYLRTQGIKPVQNLVEKIQRRYSEIYRPATENDLFVPTIVWAKNKGPIPGYYVRWDRQAYRYPFLAEAIKAAGIEIAKPLTYENQPLTEEETRMQIARHGDPKERRQMKDEMKAFRKRIKKKSAGGS